MVRKEKPLPSRFWVLCRLKSLIDSYPYTPPDLPHWLPFPSPSFVLPPYPQIIGSDALPTRVYKPWTLHGLLSFASSLPLWMQQ